MNGSSLQILFGNKLKSHRKLQSLTQSKLSELSGVSLEYISKIERGLASPSFQVIEELAAALRVSPVAFFLEETPMCAMLLREVNHRVKNNFQILANLLSLIQEQAESHKDARAVEKVRQRISTMAATHDLLADTAMETGSFSGFIHRLFDRLKDIHGADAAQAEFELEDIHLAPPEAFALGIIVNELISNALKHGSGAKKAGLYIGLQSGNGDGRLVVKNPVQAGPDEEPYSLPGAGLSIVRSIAEGQLKGHFEFHASDEAVATVTFPLSTPS
jgi:two-component sensor histidine kinase